jgi:hypothetical protein
MLVPEGPRAEAVRACVRKRSRATLAARPARVATEQKEFRFALIVRCASGSVVAGNIYRAGDFDADDPAI